MANDIRTYRPHFGADRLWVFVYIFLTGIAICGLAFFLMGTTRNEPIEAVLVMVFVAVIPIFLSGWICLFFSLDAFFSQITFTEQEIRYRKASKFFPLIPVTRKLLLIKIERIDILVQSETVNLYFHHGKKAKVFRLPRFRRQPQYLEEFHRLNEKLALPADWVAPAFVTQPFEEVRSPAPPKPLRRFFRRHFQTWAVIFVFVFTLGSGYICMQSDAMHTEDPKIFAFTLGANSAMLSFVLVSLLSTLRGILPLLITAAFWFFGRTLITLLFPILIGANPDMVILNSPQWLNVLLQRYLQLPSLHISLTNFVFCCLFFILMIEAVSKLVSLMQGAFRDSGKSKTNSV